MAFLINENDFQEPDQQNQKLFFLQTVALVDPGESTALEHFDLRSTSLTAITNCSP